MRRTTIAFALGALLLTGACKNDTDTKATADAPAATSEASNATLTPEQLGELGAAIRKNPNDAQRLLSEQGLTEESFASAVRKLSEDPAASQQYAAAYKRASA